MILFTCLAGAAYAADGTTRVLGRVKKAALVATTDTVEAGYYSSTTLHAIDPALKAENIVLGAAIFGIAGTYAGGTGHELPDTGQTTCYDAAGTVIPCDNASVDGSYQPAANQLRYSSATISGNAVTTDNLTGLMWAQNGTAAGCKSGAIGLWAAALTYCEGLSFAGYTDWRLPNVRELLSIVNYQNANPAIDATYFPGTKTNGYWSNTSYTNSSDAAAWIVWFDVGSVTYKNKTAYNNYTRCVRAGP